MIGQVFTSASYAISSKSHNCTTCTAKKPIVTVSIAGQSGGASLYYGLSAQGATVSIPGSSAFTRPAGSLVNIVSFDRYPVTVSTVPSNLSTVESAFGFNVSRPRANFQTSLDQVCRESVSTSASLVTSFVQSQYLGKAQCADPTTGAPPSGQAAVNCVKDPYLPFTGPSNNQAMQFNAAGTVALCACSNLTLSLGCVAPHYWLFAGLLTVGGPVGGQTWSVPVGTVFGLTLTGWGLGLKSSTRDYLRIIAPTSKCSDSNNRPDSVTIIKRGCPNCSSVTTQTTDIPASALRSADDATVPKISQLRVYSDHTILVFNGSIFSLLVSGDRIAVSADDVVIDGKARNGWTRVDQFRVFSLVGRGRFADELDACFLANTTDCDDHVDGHVVTVVDNSTVSIPVGLDEFESVNLTTNGANWERHSRLSTAVDMKATATATSSVVCWGRKGTGGIVSYYVPAGLITFYQPSAMTSADLTPATRLSGVAMPITLSFVPNYRKATTYTQLASNSTIVLKITLLNLAKLDFVQVTDLDPLVPQGLALNSSLAEVQSAAICGLLFSEFSLNHDDGFPQPDSCRYTAVYSDQGVNMRDLFLSFPPSDAGWRGMRAICQTGSVRSACTYQMSFQGTLGSTLTSGDSLVRVDMTCPYCVSADDPYYTFESGTALSTINTVALTGPAASQVTSLTVLSTDVTTDTFSYTAVSDKNAIVNLDRSSSVLKFAIVRNGGNAGGIPAGSVIRLTLLPQLVWNVSSIPCTATAAAVNGALTCSLSTSTNPIRRNIIKVTLPLTMTGPLTSTHTAGGDVAYPAVITVSIPTIALPQSGFFPVRFIAQVSSADDLATVYGFTSSTSFVQVNTSLVDTTARIAQAGDTGDGLLPFTRQVGNDVQIQLKLARTVAGRGSTISIHLPSGYVCGEPATGSGLPSSGQWSLTAPNVCQYTLSAGMVMNGGSWIAFNLTTSNPAEPLRRTDDSNVWSVQLGAPTADVLPASPFIGLANMTVNYTGNRAVIRPLVYAAIQPNQFALSATNTLSVFLEISSQLIPGDSIAVVAPVGFVFLSGCVPIRLLPAIYYAPASAVPLLPLFDGDLICGTWPSRTGLNIAVVTVTRIIDPGSIIGFYMDVTNPSRVPSTNDWSIYTIDPSGYAIEGSEFPVGFDGVFTRTPHGGSWPLAVASSYGSVESPVISLAPVAQTGLPVNITFTNVQVPYDVSNATLTLTLPPGFEYVDPSEDFYPPSGFPAPTFLNPGVAVFANVSIAHANPVSFSLYMWVPAEEAHWALYSASVVIEADDATVVAASLIALPVIASIKQSRVDAVTTVAGAENRIRFRFSTYTDLLTPDDSITIMGDSSTSGYKYNPFTFWFDNDTITYPADAMVTVSTDGPMEITVRPGSVPIPAGDYDWGFLVTNPDNATSEAAIWTIRSNRDYMQTVRGFRVHNLIESAGIVDSTDGRDDRPGKPNVVQFHFQLDTVNVSSILLTGPPGFLFNDNCTADVVPAVAACRGSRVDDGVTRSSAAVSVATDGFSNFSIAVARNPLDTPSRETDYWTIIVNDAFSSVSIPSFPIKNFLYFSVNFASDSLSSSVTPVSYPVRIAVVPRNSLPVTNTGTLILRTDTLGTQHGVLNYTASSAVRITAPPGYLWDTVSKEWNEFREVQSGYIYVLGEDVFLNKTANEITIVFIGTKSVDANVSYAFTGSVFAPSVSPITTGSWIVSSLEPADLSPVDQSTVTDPNPLYRTGINLTITNPLSNYAPLSLVSGIMNASLPVAVSLTDSLVVRAPVGFSFVNDSACVVNPGHASFTTACDLEDPRILTLTPNTTVAARGLISMFVNVINPSQMSPNATDNYWSLQHIIAGGDTYSASVSSWRVTSVLGTPVLAVTGANKAAQSLTSITVTFVPAMEANFVHLNITAPFGFNFSLATTTEFTMYRTLTTACWSCVALGGLNLLPGESAQFTVHGVLLGLVGGPTTVTVRTFYVPPAVTVANPLVVQSTFRDGISEADGFFFAGQLTVTESSISDGSSGLNPLINIPAVATLQFTVSLTPDLLPSASGRLDQPLAVRLVLTCPESEYQILPKWSDFSIVPSLGPLVSVPAIVNASVITAMFDSRMATLYATTNYTLQVPIVPLIATPSSAWRIEIFVNDTLLNTNDGLSEIPSMNTSIPVNPLTGLVAVASADPSVVIPPNTDVVINVNVSGPLPDGTVQLALVAPVGFEFTIIDTTCVLSTLCGALGETANQLLISASSSGDVPVDVGLRVQLHTPTAIETNDWLVVGYADSGLVVGWGAVLPIAIQPMRGVSIIYGGMSGVQSALAILTFFVGRNGTVNSIEVVPPVGLSLVCYGADAIDSLNCISDSTLSVGLILKPAGNATYLTAGVLHSIPIRAAIPLGTPTDNTFDIIATNLAGTITDGIYGVPGRAVVDSLVLAVRTPTVRASTAVAGATATITLSFYLAKPTTSIDAINIQFPNSYFHEIFSASRQVICVNRRFPRTSPTDWVDVSSTQSVSFLVDNTVTSIIDLNTGNPLQLNKIPGSQTYTFEFPVVLPSATPEGGNYWILSFCANRTRIAECIEHGEAIAQFPILASDIVSPA